MTKVCICGGGSLGLVCSAVLASHPDVSVNIYTRHPEKWSLHVTAIDSEGTSYSGRVSDISSDPCRAVSGCDVVFLCLPGYAIRETLSAIKPFLREEMTVGSVVSSTGFFFFAHEILSPSQKLFGFQRPPFIARTFEYGKKGLLLGYKKQVSIATENISPIADFQKTVERLWLTPVRLLNNFYEASLTNSNPILHTGRLYTMWKNWDGEPYQKPILFYKEWDVSSSETIIVMDKEFQILLKRLPVSDGAIPPLLEYYESNDAETLCDKIMLSQERLK